MDPNSLPQRQGLRRVQAPRWDGAPGPDSEDQSDRKVILAGGHSQSVSQDGVSPGLLSSLHTGRCPSLIELKAGPA